MNKFAEINHAKLTIVSLIQNMKKKTHKVAFKLLFCEENTILFLLL